MSVGVQPVRVVPESRLDWLIYEKELPFFWDREKVPSVSQLFTWEFGAPPHIDPVRSASTAARRSTSALHYKDDGDLDLESTKEHKELLGYMRQWAAFLKPDDTFLAIEKPLFGTLGDIDYIVRPDRVIQRGSKTLIVDIKTKSRVGRGPDQKEQKKHALEVAFQRIAVAQRIGPEADWVGCAYLWPHKLEVLGYNDARLHRPGRRHPRAMGRREEPRGGAGGLDETEQQGAGGEEDQGLARRVVPQDQAVATAINMGKQGRITPGGGYRRVKKK